MSKIFDFLRQISNFIEPCLSKQQCGFRKGYTTQHCLLVLLEKWKLTTDKVKYTEALLTDLSKVFDYLPHDLSLAKLYVHGVNEKVLRLIQIYLSNR